MRRRAADGSRDRGATARALGALGREPREAVRLLLRRPQWALLAALTLAVGMAALAAAVAVGEALFLTAMPGIARPQELVRVALPDGSSYPELRGLARDARTLRDVAGFADLLATVRTEAGGERLLALLASERYFDVLGVRMERGRGWSDAEAAAAASVAVVGHDYWQRRLGGDPHVLGRVLRVQGVPFTVVGVAPPGFVGTFRGFGFDLWLPLSCAPRVAPVLDLADPALRRFEVIARLAPGTSRAAAGAELRTLVGRLRPQETRRAEALPLTGFDEEVRQPALALVAVLVVLAALVLTITVANVAGVLLARTLVRRRELAVRAALGASRGQLVRLLFWEASLVAAGGAVLGGLAAGALGRALLAALPPLPVRITLDLSPGPRAYAALAAAAAASALLLAAVAAREAGRSPATALRVARGGGRGQRLRSALVVGQVAAASALLLLAGAFLLPLRRAARADALGAVLV
ncbi:MAG TPA: ABC transporter permease, partial [Thermoanaerobaculia bacterium]|nr:ABC transporter permease [Thermoanaerobaculia bacterium]